MGAALLPGGLLAGCSCCCCSCSGAATSNPSSVWEKHLPINPLSCWDRTVDSCWLTSGVPKLELPWLLGPAPAEADTGQGLLRGLPSCSSVQHVCSLLAAALQSHTQLALTLARPGCTAAGQHLLVRARSACCAVSGLRYFDGTALSVHAGTLSMSCPSPVCSTTNWLNCTAMSWLLSSLHTTKQSESTSKPWMQPLWKPWWGASLKQ